MFAANVFTIIDSQDMQGTESARACCPNSRRRAVKARGLKIAHRFLELAGYPGQRPSHGRPDQLERYEARFQCVLAQRKPVSGRAAADRSSFAKVAGRLCGVDAESSSGWVTPGGLA
jgi:hypothetical protein